jgi:hypothetical protein
MQWPRFPATTSHEFWWCRWRQQHLTCPPTSYKHWENRNYCRTQGSDVDNTHTSAMCGKPGPLHNPNASRTNIMGGSVAGMHKTILPSVCGRTPPNCGPQQQQLLQQRLPIAYYTSEGMAWQQPTTPAQFGGMPPASSTYRQRTTMAVPVYQPRQEMINFVGQYPPSARNMPMIQMSQQLMAVPMMMNYYAPNQPQPAAGVLLTSRGR